MDFHRFQGQAQPISPAQPTEPAPLAEPVPSAEPAESAKLGFPRASFQPMNVVATHDMITAPGHHSSPCEHSKAVHAPLPVREGLFTHRELRKAVRGLRSGRATRDGDISVECFKALASGPGTMLHDLLDFFDDCLLKHVFSL